MTTTVEMKLELIHIPVSDVDRARDFYVKQCGWELITDHVQMGDMRIVQIVPPGSGCAILMGRNIPEITDMPVGVQKGIHLVVADMQAARDQLTANGVELGEPFDMTGPAVSKHLRVLERAGLVSRSRVAQARPAILEAAPLEAVAEWAEEFRQFWDERFDRLEDYLTTMTDPEVPTKDDAGSFPGP